ncbi:protealysin inhibitor emfourin [Pilimelia columellifera]|uniref:Uncharacterized protein n=1 Tax=Pilimelia columellifera subsp. columellifera TaxID=706583 RepID=A0ABP6AY45_9ACTN
MRIRLLATLTMLPILAAGCGPVDASRTSSSGSPTASSDAAAPVPSGTAQDPGKEASLLSYHRTGGFAGFDDQLAVSTDGSYRLTRRQSGVRTGQLTAADLAEVRRASAAAKIATLPTTAPTTGMADGFSYVLTYQGATVKAVDGQVPATLEPLLSVLNEVITRYSA